MGYHRCPIEPSDWSDGPNDPEPVDCPDCEGTGRFSRDECVVDGIHYPAIHGKECDTCDGTGGVDPPECGPFDDDVI